MGGTIVFRGTRVPAQTIIDYLDGGHNLEVFLGDFPTVNRQDAVEFLKLVREENHSG